MIINDNNNNIHIFTIDDSEILQIILVCGVKYIINNF